MDKNFIITKDENTRLTLLKNGFTNVSNSNGVAVFINDKKKFSKFKDKNLKITYSNIMTF